tara:strand:+ start:621 stop:1007 length:387 start_codon:yes stop_codon:yes gene_type:complete
MSYDLFKDYVPAISHSKKKLMDSEDDQWEKKYLPYYVNRNFSNFQDTIMHAQEMNIYHLADNKMQFDFLINSIRPRKRFSKWHKKIVHNDFETVKQYYGYNNKKTEQALSILTREQIEHIRGLMNKGG